VTNHPLLIAVPSIEETEKTLETPITPVATSPLLDMYRYPVVSDPLRIEFSGYAPKVRPMLNPNKCDIQDLKNHPKSEK
jgi:hypothetical protein